jgi:hypothetical protein
LGGLRALTPDEPGCALSPGNTPCYTPGIGRRHHYRRSTSSGGHGGGAIDVGTLLLLGIALLAHGSAIRSSHQTGASPRDGG